MQVRIRARLPRGFSRALEFGQFHLSGVIISLEKLKAEYYRHHRATSPEARFFIDELIFCEWTLRRLRHASHAILTQASQGPTRHIEANTHINSEKSQARLQTRINATRLAYHRALKDLQRLEAQEAFAIETADEAAEEAPIAETVAASPSPETDLHDLGSLRKSPGAAPEPAAETALILPEAS